MLESVEALVLGPLSAPGLLNVLGPLKVLGLLNVLGLFNVLVAPLLSGLGLFSALGLLRPELVVAPGPRGRTGPPRLFLVPARGELNVDPTSGDGLGSAGAGVSVLGRAPPSNGLGEQLTPGVIAGDGDGDGAVALVVALPGVDGLGVGLVVCVNAGAAVNAAAHARIGMFSVLILINCSSLLVTPPRLDASDLPTSLLRPRFYPIIRR